MNTIPNHQKTLYQIGLSLILLIIAGTFTARPAYAAAFTVACNDIAGLIAAINTANSNGEADTITLADNCTYALATADNTANGPSGLPAIAVDSGNLLTINGNGATLTRGTETNFRFFYVLSGANLTLQNLSLTAGNPGANPGGAIFNQGTLSLVQVTIRGNTATQGGGIKNDTGATLTIDRSTINDNLAVLVPGKGGAIYSDGTMTLVNSTISSNTAQDDGAGMEVGATSNTTIINSTIAFNITQGSPGEGGAIFNFGGAPVTVRNSILANNVGVTGPNCYGPVISQGNNLSNTGECSLNAAGDLLNTEPNLGALLNNGGATQTHAPTSGSPAIDAGDAGACAAAPVNGIDQRNVVRPQGAGCDIGAYETFLIDFNGLATQSGEQAKDELNNAYAARGLSFDFYQLYLTYPTTDGATVTVATHPGGADALVNFAFAADFVRVKYAASDGLEAYLTAYAQPFTADLVPATTIDAASNLGNPYPKSLTVTGACIRSVQLETNGFEFSFDDLEIHPMSGPDTDGDGIVDQCDSEFIVNSNDDSDDGVCDGTHCSLREAILAANAKVNGATPDEIHFNIPGAGVKTIQPTSALPFINDPVVIDGSTQPGASCTVWPPTLQIELSGINAGGASGLVAFVGNNTVRGLVINRFGNTGIYLDGAGNNTIQCNFIGTDATGELDRGNVTGIWVNNIANNIIGGTTPGQGNLVTANFSDGLWIVGPNANDNIVQGNYIGTNATGTTQVGHSSVGIGLSGSNNLVGGPLPGAANVIVGTNSYGMNIFSPSGAFNTIQGNYIGTNAAGSIGLYNLTNGIVIDTGAHDNSIKDNVIARNNRHGIYILDATSANNVIQGNWIGTDIAGTASLPNSENGILIDAALGTIIGGVTANEANTIINNGGHGVAIVNTTAVNNRVRGNHIYANGGLGIDLGADGVTFNHQGAIAGPNNYQNYPVLTLATSQGSSIRVQGTLEGTASTTFDIDLFANTTCDESAFGEGQTFLSTIQVTTDASGKAIFDQTFATAVSEGQSVSATATDLATNNTSEFSYCRVVATNNVTWQAAQLLNLTEVGAGLVGDTVQQRIMDRFQEKWFRFPVGPGDKVHIELTSVPGSAVSLHRDPLPFYNSLTNPQSVAVLSAAAADTGFLPSQYLPSQYLPSQYLPSQYLPSQSLPSQYLPSQSLPSQYLPSQYLPSQYLPSGTLPTGALPSQYLPSQYLPSQYLPSQYLAEAYSGAARRSLIGVSLDPYATVQTIDRNTYDLLEDVYVRVVGPYDPANPFTLKVTVEGGICSVLQPVPTDRQIIAGPPLAAGAHKTLILTDSGRLPGSPAEIAMALEKLQLLAGRPDVDGVVIDLAETKYERVVWAHEQADQNLACPTAKNIVADEIKRVIDSYRAANMASGNTTLQYIVLAGSASVIPFFQVPDVAGLANEKEYVVPVKPSTASEAGLKVGLVQGQDGYGTQANISRGDHTFAVPDLAVGRLVDTANDISTIVDAYIATNGMVTPNSALVTGYDFVGDAAEAIKIETDAGTSAPSDTLIQGPGLPPSDPSAWSADDMRAKLFAGGHDLVVLSGHFSAGDLLAADYRTSISASEVAASPVFANVVIFTLGCHGGYTIPSNDLLASASPDPDWAKAFLRQGAAGYIAATGYAYGDTELTEYGERLFVQLTKELRTGSEPVALGQALVAAKQRYLAQTAQLTGIDEKTLVEMTLYGLPMMKVNMPGERINPAPETSIVTVAAPVTSGPGAGIGLRVGQPVITPELTEKTKQLQNLADNSTIGTTYFLGKDGAVANPFEPIFPKEIYNVNVNGAVLRGVAFRGGEYTDQAGVTPLTTAPATEISRPHTSFNSDVFYPTQMWLPNYFDAINGGPARLVAVPGQFKSSVPGATDGTLRKFNNLQLNLYYLDANWPAGSATTKAAAVAAAPTILGVSGSIVDTNVKFSVNVQGEAAAGIQAVWILYTGRNGSPFYGQWQPLDLTQPNPTLDPILWEGTLPLNGANPADILFMVQVVNAAGSTTLATNLGVYYTVAPSTPPPPPKATTLTLASQLTAGAYQRDTSFTLFLTSESGQALANQPVILALGGQAAQATTNGDGSATITLQPSLLPGNYPIQATFRGNEAYLGSSTTRSFTVVKDSTTVALSPQSPSLVALVRDSAGRALNEKSVIFVVAGNNQTLVRSVITDLDGNAALGEVLLPPGTYTVDAYFRGVIPVGNDQIITLEDDFYEPSHATGALTTGATDTSAPLVAVSFPAPPANQNGWFNAANAINGIVGSVTANETTTGGSNITAINCTGATVGTLSGTGTVQASGSPTVVNEGSNVVSCTAIDSTNNNGAAPGSINTATVKIDKTAPDTVITSQPANPSGTSVTFAFTGNDGTGSGVVGFECKLDTGSFVSCTNSQTYNNLPNGSHTFTVHGIDAAGNIDATPASYTWTVQSNPNTLVGSCGGYDVYRTPQGQYVAAGWTGTIKVGTTGNNTLKGASGRDLMLGLAGNDTLQGQGGDDILCGGDGNDLVQGFAGNDYLDGGIGTDVLNGGAGDYDQLLGGDGNDVLLDGDGVIVASGGAGNDLLTLTLRRGWRNLSNQARFEGLAAGYGNDIVGLAILDSTQFYVSLTGDERDNPPSPLEGNQDKLGLVGKITTTSEIIKFEQRAVTGARTMFAISDDAGAEYLPVEEENQTFESALNQIFLPLVTN